MRNILIFLSLFTINFACMQGQTNTRIEYINKYKDLAIRLQKEYKIPASIKLAQAILESDAGTSNLARRSNNHFGIKCKPEWRGARVFHDDDAKNECFRAYKTVEESYLDHSLFLSQRIYYVSLFDLDIYDYEGWAYGLQRSGYATDKQYAVKLLGIIKQFELYKYDRTPVIETRPIFDDIYDVKPHLPQFPASITQRRRIYETNDVHYITALPDDTYEVIAYDARMKLKRLLKYNEITTDHQLNNGDMVFLQAKKRQAGKEHTMHVVKVGESIHSISQMYGMKMKSIYKFNKLRDDYIPKAGDILKVRKK